MNLSNLNSTYIRVFYFIIIALVFTACNDAQTKNQKGIRHLGNRSGNISFIPEVIDLHRGVSIINTGPRGGVYIDSKGRALNYRVFRVQLFNDTTCPIQIKLNISNLSYKLFPDSTQSVNLFLFPDSLYPYENRDTLNFGLKSSELYLETALKKTSIYEKTLQPDETGFIYFGCIMDGIARAKLFFEGQSVKDSFLKIGHKNINSKKSDSMHVFFGLANIDPYSKIIIPIGELIFKD